MCVYLQERICHILNVQIYYIEMASKSKKRSQHKKKATKRTRGTRGTKKQRGGVSFNEPYNEALLPPSTYYPYNMRVDDPQDPSMVTDSRLLNCSGAPMHGGKKQRRSKRRGTKKQKGGNLLQYSSLPGTNAVFAFGSSGGSEYVKNTLLANPHKTTGFTSESSIPTLA